MTQGIDNIWQAEARTQQTKQLVRDIKRITRRKFTAEEKIRIVLEGFRCDTPIRDLCRREGIKPSTYYAWLKEESEKLWKTYTGYNSPRQEGSWKPGLKGCKSSGKMGHN